MKIKRIGISSFLSYVIVLGIVFYAVNLILNKVLYLGPIYLFLQNIFDPANTPNSYIRYAYNTVMNLVLTLLQAGSLILVYNLIAKYFGGLKLEFQEDKPKKKK